MSIFHLAFKVNNLPSTRQFYIDILGCTEGRSTTSWIDFNFFGHQLSAHLSEDRPPLDYCGKVDQVAVPIPHFGVVLSVAQFKEVQRNLEQAGVEFMLKPQLRYKGKVGEQWTLFVFDFSGNPLEFKAFSKEEEIFL